MKKLKRSRKSKLPGKRPLFFYKHFPPSSLFPPSCPEQILRNARSFGAIYEIVLRQSCHIETLGINGDC